MMNNNKLVLPTKAAKEKAKQMVDDIAQVCHAANQAYCALLGDPGVAWEDTTDSLKDSIRQGVIHIMNHPDTTPARAHELWTTYKLKQGWKYGKVKDEDKLTHPNLVPYNHLPLNQQIKDSLFRNIVLAMI